MVLYKHSPASNNWSVVVHSGVRLFGDFGGVNWISDVPGVVGFRFCSRGRKTVLTFSLRPYIAALRRLTGVSATFPLSSQIKGDVTTRYCIRNVRRGTDSLRVHYGSCC